MNQQWRRGNRWMGKEQMLAYDAKERGETIQEAPLIPEEPEVVEEVTPEPEVVEEPEVAPEPEAVEEEADEPAMNFMALKALAKEKGMDVQPTTKKAEVMEFLSNL